MFHERTGNTEQNVTRITGKKSRIWTSSWDTTWCNGTDEAFDVTVAGISGDGDDVCMRYSWGSDESRGFEWGDVGSVS